MENQAKRLSVIIIDDDIDVAESLTVNLLMRGIDVLGIANDGKQAVELYANVKPDVVIMDVMMPRYDGFYGVENILKTNPDAKIIIVTGSSDVCEKKVKELDVSAIFSKPYKIDEVIETINKVIRESLVQYPQSLNN